MMRTLLATWLVAVLANQAVAETVIFVPNEYENAEAPDGVRAEGGSSYPDGYRFQTVFDASEFASLPTTQQTMTGYFMRPDALRGSANSTSWPHFTLKMSTTTATLTTLSNEFAANSGPDETVVYDGPITFTTANIGPQRGPMEFDIAFDFQTPFHYDPTQGNLLMDWYVVGPAGWVGHDQDDSITGISTGVSTENRDEPLGELSDGIGTAVFKFTFVPEPSSITLTTLGFVALLTWRRKTLSRE